MSDTASNAAALPKDTKTSAKKRKTKAPANRPPSSDASGSQAQDHGVNGTRDSPGESQYFKELNRNIRNIHKKLAASAKTDSIIVENPAQSLDDLVASKKINADQKAQVLKKPALQAQLAQLEEQLKHYRNFGQEYESRLAAEKASLQAAYDSAIVEARQEAADETRQEMLKKQNVDLLVLSQFLHAAAAKRQSDEAETQEGRAYEGVLLLAYQGNSTSLEVLRSLVDGMEDKVPDTQGELLDFTYTQLKKSAMENAPLPAELDDPDLSEATAEVVEPSVQANVTHSDPTIANAGLTELEDTTTIRLKGVEYSSGLISGLEQASVAADAANAVADSSWDPQASVMTTDSTMGDGWVEVPRDPAETDTGVVATPAAAHGTSSWAEEVTEGAAAETKAAAENDGFEQVIHHSSRGRGRGRGEPRGRAARGDRMGRGRGIGEDGRRAGGGRGRGRTGEGYRGHRGGKLTTAATSETPSTGNW